MINFKNRLIYLRNFLNIRPIKILNNKITEYSSISDAFFWRTDNGYKSIFRFSDLLGYFFGDKNENVEFIFFDKMHKKIKTLKISTQSNINEIVIDKKFLNNTEDYGVFYIFHNSSKKYNTSIRNSCYTGYSLNNCLPSFVHGNCPTAYQSENKLLFDLVGNSFFKNQKYAIQRKFEDNLIIELAINNPLNKKLSLNINGINHVLEPHFSKIIKIKKENKIVLKSNCLFLRPIIFEKNNNFINVHHG